MITDWYFLNCLHFPPRRAAVLLSILEVLDAREPDAALVIMSLRELEKAEISVQIYALPKLLRMVRRVSEGNVRIREMVLGLSVKLIESAEESLQERLGRLVRRCIVQEADRDAANEAAELAKQLASCWSAVRPSAPYLDLKERIPETILLAILEAFLSNSDPQSAGHVEGVIEAGANSLSVLIEAALEGKLGRLAFIQGLQVRDEIANAGTGKKLSWFEIVAPLIKLKGALPLDEPDLMQATATAIFRAPLELSYEIFRLKAFRRLRRALQMRPRKDEQHLRKQVAARLGLDGDESKSAVQVLLWQMVLANLLAKQDPALLSGRLEFWWRPLPSDLPEFPMPVTLADKEQNRDSWLECLADPREFANSHKLGQSRFLLNT